MPGPSYKRRGKRGRRLGTAPTAKRARKKAKRTGRPAVKTGKLGSPKKIRKQAYLEKRAARIGKTISRTGYKGVSKAFDRELNTAEKALKSVSGAILTGEKAVKGAVEDVTSNRAIFGEAEDAVIIGRPYLGEAGAAAEGAGASVRRSVAKAGETAPKPKPKAPERTIEPKSKAPKPEAKPPPKPTAKPKPKPKVRPKQTAPAPKPIRPTAAKRLARGAGTTAKVGAKTASYPLRHPLKTTKYAVAAQAPAALATGDPKEFLKPLEGKGVVADVSHAVSGAVGDLVPGGEIAQNLVRDVIDLPANTPPAIYLPVAALVEKAAGDGARLEQLWRDYEKTGLIPSVLSGDANRIKDSITAHPLFAALEASGVKAVAGRGAGAALRSGALGKKGKRLGSVERKPIRLGGDLEPVPRLYSRDVINKGFQAAADRRRGRKQGGQKATPREVEKILVNQVDRAQGIQEGVRHGKRSEVVGAATGVRKTGSKVPGRRKYGKEAQAGVSPVVQKIARSPATYAQDIQRYLIRLKEVAPTLKGRELQANRKMQAELRLALKADPKEVFAMAEPLVAQLNAQQKRLVEAGLLEPEQAAKAALFPYAFAHMGAKYGPVDPAVATGLRDLAERIERGDPALPPAQRKMDPEQLREAAVKIEEDAGKTKTLLDNEGKPLTAEKIREDMAASGVSEPAYVSHSTNARGPGSFYRAFAPERQTLPKRKRTGAAIEKGTFDPTFDSVVEQIARSNEIATAVEGFDRELASRFAASREQFSTYERALQEAERLGENTALGPLRPVRLASFTAKKGELARAEEIFQKLDPSDQGGINKFLDDVLNDAIGGKPGEAGPYILVPETVLTRFREHFKTAGTFRRSAQVVSAAFKGVVLPLSPNWYMGNLLDMSMRSLLYGTTPFGKNALLGRRLVKELEKTDPQAAYEVKAGILPGALFGSAERNLVHRDARQFAGTGIAPFARAMGTLRRTPGPKQLVDAYVLFRNGAFKLNDIAIERQAQYAILGRTARREVRMKTGQWHKGLKLGDDAIADLAKGLTNRPTQIRYAKAVEEVLGKWTGNSPAMREFLVDYAPFGMWTRAATKFVAITLPAKHPIKTAIAAAAFEMTEEERDKLGLSMYAERPLPPNLQGSIPTGEGGLIAPQTLTSFGFFSDYQEAIANSILPQVPIQELAGVSWTGDKLTYANGQELKPEARLAVALMSTAEAFIPFLSIAQRSTGFDLVNQEQGPRESTSLGETLKPRVAKPYDKGLVDYLRDKSVSRTITIPPAEKGKKSSSSSSSSSGALDWGAGGAPEASSSSSSEGGGLDWGGGGGGESTSSSSDNKLEW